MAETVHSSSDVPTTEEGFLQDRRAFWGSTTRIVTYAVAGLAALLLVLWWWLV